MKDSEIIRMGYSIQAYFEKTGEEIAKPKDLMPWLIELGYFNKDHREGLPLRDVLRRLDNEGKLFYLPNLIPEKKEKNTYWTFIRIVH